MFGCGWFGWPSTVRASTFRALGPIVLLPLPVISLPSLPISCVPLRTVAALYLYLLVFLFLWLSFPLPSILFSVCFPLLFPICPAFVTTLVIWVSLTFYFPPFYDFSAAAFFIWKVFFLLYLNCFMMRFCLLLKQHKPSQYMHKQQSLSLDSVLRKFCSKIWGPWRKGNIERCKSSFNATDF